tara:strand:+ start:507 stop:662 length:156 start_codon:yes stop_codon:yes gene_type:complete
MNYLQNLNALNNMDKSDLVDLVYDLVNDIDKAETLADLQKLKGECGLRHNK